MDCMPSIRWPITLLLGCSCPVATALASGPTEPRPASEEPSAQEAWDPPLAIPAETRDALPLLLELHASEDWQGLRTESLKADFYEADPRYTYMAAVAVIELGRSEEGVLELDPLMASAQVGELSRLKIAGTWMEASPRLGVVQYQAYLESYPQGEHRDYAAWQAARGLASEGRFSMALTQLEVAQLPMSPELSLALTSPPRWKRPMLASFLSGALPGAGQLYAGQPREAASALLVNAALFAGLGYAASQENWATVGVLGFFGLGFYSGNIYGAADAAVRHNRGVRDEILEAFPEVDEPLPQ
jgi:hypothetical protein